MRSSSLLLAVCAALVSIAETKAETFVRAGGAFMHYHESGFANRGGYTLAVGTTLDDDATQEFALEIGDFGWGYRRRIPGDVHVQVVGFYNAEDADGHFRPVLASYRYYSSWAEDRLRFFVGASAGVAQVGGDWTRSTTGSATPVGTTSFDKWKLTCGLGMGVRFAVTERSSIEAGYQLMTTGGFSAGTDENSDPKAPRSFRLKFPSLRTSTVQIGYSYSF